MGFAKFAFIKDAAGTTLEVIQFHGPSLTREEDTMASIPLSEIEIFGRGALQVEDVVIDKDGFVYGGGRNGIMYKVSPDGQVSELVQLPEGSIPNGVTMDKNGDLIYCDLGKQAVMRVTQAGQVSMIADRVGDVKLSLPNFATYDAEGNLFVSNTSTADINTVLPELSQPAPNGALVCIRPNGKKRGRGHRHLRRQRHGHRPPGGSRLRPGKLAPRRLSAHRP